MMLRYPCLVLDHDDTVVRSTPEVHFPSFNKVLKLLRPNQTLSYEDFLRFCYDPGFSPLCYDILKFTQEEMDFQEKLWREHARETIPHMFDGMDKLIRKQKDLGGILCVVSHSSEEYIRRDYRENIGIEPDMVFGLEFGAEKSKPFPYPLLEIQKKFGFSFREMLMADDLTPGLQMAQRCGVNFVYAAWTDTLPEIKKSMKQKCPLSFDRVDEFYRYLFEKEK